MQEKQKWYKDFITWQVFMWIMAGVFCLLMLGVKTSMEAKAKSTEAIAKTDTINRDIEWIKSSLLRIEEKIK